MDAHNAAGVESVLARRRAEGMQQAPPPSPQQQAAREHALTGGSTYDIAARHQMVITPHGYLTVAEYRALAALPTPAENAKRYSRPDWTW